MPWEGIVTAVHDGDTITITHNSGGERIRLYGVDCPELKQDFGVTARDFVSDLCLHKTVEVDPQYVERYGRVVSIVTVKKQCLNSILLKKGCAWFCGAYCKKPYCTEWKRFEDEAKKSKRGLWSGSKPVAPWVWRHSKK
jgi:endonuclease YncB( thermonuclease family)